jgi:ribosomal-protein-alanine N-acetyltransferase
MPTLPSGTATRASRNAVRVYLRPPRASDRQAFLAAVAASRQLHRGWVLPPATAAGFATYLARFAGPQSRNPARATNVGCLVCRADDDSPVGVYNLSEIVRGSFHSAYLGYYALAPHAAAGYMGEGLALLLAVAYRGLKLHRVEANIQPSNAPSIALVRRAGFTREGFSRRYVKIGGRWRDHERWAMLAEDWRARRRPSR